MVQLKRFERIFIDQGAVTSEVAKRIRDRLPEVPWEVCSSPPYPERRGELTATEFSESKRLLYITPFKGSFFKRCPGSRPGLLCCNYFVLNLGLQCDMNCSYCYLQSFINSPTLTIYSNIDQAIAELESLAVDMGEHKVRVGTGEVIDSLSLDDLTLYSRDLISAFRRFPNWTLEFKTKSDKVDQFLEVEHAGNVVVSWSVNPQFIIDTEEKLTASLAQRLDAASRCRARGFPIAFHIDPMIWHPDWQINYLGLVEEICRRFSPEDVNVISVGALRYQPEQRHMMRERFGFQSWVTRAETHPSDDGKWRYDQSLRTEMYNAVLGEFRRRDPRWRIFLCMETAESWLGTMAQVPQHKNDLKDLFSSEVLRAHRRHRALASP